MFKQKKLATGIAMGVLGVAGVIASVQAVYLNSDGTGQVLLFPYFNAQPGYVTNINLVNSTDQTKAVKVRIRDGRNSNDILNFNLYMPPADSWSGSLQMGSNSKGQQVGMLTSKDRTCAMPMEFSAKCGEGECEIQRPFQGFEAYGVTPQDTREGYVEVIEMGVVTASKVTNGVRQKYANPENCQVVADAWEDKLFMAGSGKSAKSLSKPTGGLFGSSAVINLEQGNAMNIDPVAIDNYSTEPQHYNPTDSSTYSLPSLASGNVTQSSKMVQTATGDSELVVTQWKTIDDPCLNDGDKLTGACGTNPYPIAHALLAPYLMNEYWLDPSLGYDAHTDWVVTFPMKKHGIHKNSNDVLANVENNIFDNGGGNAAGLAAVFGFAPPKGVGSKALVGNQSVLEREVNVLSFESLDPSYNASRTVLSSPTAQAISVGPFVTGWARLGFANYNLAAGFKSAQSYGPKAYANAYNANSPIYQGVPAVGFAAIEGKLGENPSGVGIPHKKH